MALKVQGTELTGITKFWMGVSHLLPTGGATYDYENSNTEKVYFCLDGEITVYDKDKKNKYVLSKGDSIFIPPFEGRTLVNETNETASMLVVIDYPDA
jgi:glyoxylate utilization-related uncharacterized protein